MNKARNIEVKMFIHNNPADAEKAVNSWLANNPVSITEIAQSQSEKGGNFLFVLSVFYQQQ